MSKMVLCKEIVEDVLIPSESASSTGLPERMFAPTHEPVGVRVSAYHTYDAIRAVLSVLEEEEVQFLRASPFGKFLTTADKPSFSGRFVRFLLSRQLKVKKKHEAWFLFASQPVRFSIREFAIVTGLHCGKFPKQSKRRTKKNIKEKPYWPTLFGKLETVSVKAVLRMLKKKTVKEQTIRIKYACLALLSSVLLPTTHHPKISRDHVELIKDLDFFFKYPWGRVGFDLLMCSLKKRDEVSLSQNTLALKGFVQSIQLVLVEAVPELTFVVEDYCSSDSEVGTDSDDDNEDEDESVQQPPKISLSPGHARKLHEDAQCAVTCIISPPEGTVIIEDDLLWSDEEVDERVQNLVDLVNSGHTFTGDMFEGGYTTDDITRMRAEAHTRATKKKIGSRRGRKAADTSPFVDVDGVATSVVTKIRKDFLKVEEKVNRSITRIEDLKNELLTFKSDLLAEIGKQMKIIQAAVTGMVKDFSIRPASAESDPTSKTNGRRRSVSVGFIPLSPTTVEESPMGNTTEKNEDDPSQLAGTKDTKAGRANNMTEQSVWRPRSQTRAVVVSGKQRERIASAESGRGVFRHQDKKDEVVKAYAGGGNAFHRTGYSGGDYTDENFDSIPATFTGTREKEGHVGIDCNDCNIRPALPSLPASFSLKRHARVELVEECGDVPLADAEIRGKRQKIGGNDVSVLDDDLLDLDCFEKNSLMVIPGSTATDEYVQKFSHLKNKILNHFSTITVGGVQFNGTEFSEIWNRTTHMSAKMVDVLIYQITQQYVDLCPRDQLRHTFFLTTKFVSQFSHNISRFSKTPRKEFFQFPKTIIRYFDGADATPPFGDRFYFPFNMEKKHWIGICMDCRSWSLHVLDCNTSYRSDKQIGEMVKPFAEMFPYLLKQVGRYLTLKDMRPFSICRPSGIQQNKKTTDSSVTTVLLIKAHALGGLEMCNSVSARDLESECQRLAVSLYEENGEDV